MKGKMKFCILARERAVLSADGELIPQSTTDDFLQVHP